MRSLLVLAAVVACGACDRETEPPPLPSPDSNVRAADYIGPAACGACHPDEHARWSGSLHRVMNARSDVPGAIIGDFSGASLDHAGGHVTFTHDPTGYVMALTNAGTTRTYRITRTIGRRGLQEYVGIEKGGTLEVRLPFGWWPAAGGWQPQTAFDPWLDDGTDLYAPLTQPWAARCPWCHSTYPFEQRIARSDARQVGHGHEQHVTLTAPSSPSATPELLAVDSQVTTGISCESCHLGGRAHAAGGAIHFTPHGAATRTGHEPAVPDEPFADERRSAAIVNETCAQCHSGPSPRLADGTALRNSSEALDLAASPCTTARCTDCHDPHAGESHHDREDVEKRAIAACTKCHERLADPDTAVAHVGPHTNASCLDCHMPRVVMGIDRFVRTHRISSPTDARVAGAGDPNACNLCHLDRSLAWTAAGLARTYDVHLGISKGVDVDTPLGEQWLASPKPSIRVLAIAAYGPRFQPKQPDPSTNVRAWTRILTRPPPSSSPAAASSSADPEGP